MEQKIDDRPPSAAFGRPTAAQRMDAILRVATRLFNRRGVGGATLDDVAAELGIRKASLYNYIKSKNELLFLCHMRALEAHSKVMDVALSSSGNGIEKVQVYLNELHRVLWGEPNMFPLLVLFDVPDEYKNSEEGQKALAFSERELERIRGLFEEGMKDGSIRKSDPEIMIHAFESPYACMTQWYGLWDHPPGENVHAVLNEFILNGLKSHPE